MEIEVGILTTEKIMKLRHEVLWPHLDSVDKCTIDPDNLESTFHIGAENESEVVGTSTFIIDINSEFEESNQYRLRAMATSEKVRGCGVGEKIIEAGIAELKSRGVKLLWCDARIIATGFYEKMGFSVKGDIYEVPNIGPHKLMYKIL